MKYIKVALLVLLSVACVTGSKQRMANKRHVKSLKHYRCNKPQARVFELEDIIPQDILKDKYEGMRSLIKPPVTILHRCLSAGCCEDPEERCMPALTQNVTLTFAVFHTKSLEYFDVKVTNHTECACMRKDINSIK